jgi:GntR family transcriptional regulator
MEKPTQIDRQSFEPAYAQLVNIIRSQIASGVYRPGGRLPGESKLCRTYNVSPMTVRRSIKLLLDQGVVDTVRGSGTYVRGITMDTMAFRLNEFHRIFKDTENTRVQLLEVQVLRADDLTARKLDIGVGDRVISIRRRIRHKREPVLYHTECILCDPFAPIVEAEMEVTSLHGLFFNTGETSLKRGELAIEAIVLNKDEAEMLNAPEMLPAFRLEHVFYDFDDRRISWGRFVCRSDRFRFTTEIGFPVGK